MMNLRRVRRDAPRALSVFFVLFAVSCSGSGGDPPIPPCTTCPPPPNAGLRLTVEFDAAARGLQPSGFRVQDLTRIDLLVEGGGGTPKTIQLTPPQEASFLAVVAGSYTVTAIAYQSDLVMFTGSSQVAVASGDTASVRLPMQVALGEVTFEIDGRTTGTVEAVALQDVPFVVRVRNLQGRPVPNAAVQLRSSNGIGVIAFSGNNATDAQGEVRGTIRAPRSGAMSGFTLTVDNRSVSVSTALAIQFATAVDAFQSEITALTPTGVPITNDGAAQAEFTVVVRNSAGAFLADIPVSATSSRNAGVDPNVDRIVPLPGYESGKTDAFGVFAFAVSSTTSGFMQLDNQGRLFSARDAGRVFHPSTIRVVADGVAIDQRDITFTSVVNPNAGNLLISPQFVPADGQSSALIVVNARELAIFGANPAAGVFVELTNAFNESLNYELNIQPEPGFDGFRTNAQGEWRGRLRSATPVTMFFFAKSDGRALIINARSVIFR
jgi:hypothetical protein